MKNNFHYTNLSRFYQQLSRREFPLKLIWIGLDNVGKSSLIKRLKTGEFYPNLPRTMGLTVDRLFYEADSNFEIISWDLGGQVYFRENLWKEYLRGASAIIYVVDSSTTDKARIEEAKHELWEYVLAEKNQIDQKLPILILLNKTDKGNIEKEKEVFLIELGLEKVHFNIELFKVSALTGLYLDEAFTWLFTQLTYMPKSKK